MTKETVMRALRTQVVATLIGLTLAFRAWRSRATAAFAYRLRPRGIDRLSDHMLEDIGLSRQEKRKAADWLSRS